MPEKTTPSSDDEYRPVIGADFGTDGTNASATQGAPAKPAGPAHPGATPVPAVDATGPADRTGSPAGPEAKESDGRGPKTPTDVGQAAPAAAEPVRYVRKEPNAIGRWFLRNLFSLLVIVLAAILVVSNFAMPTYQAPLPAVGTLSLRYILLTVTGQTWVFLTIMFVAGFLAGVFFLRRHKVREKKADKKR